MKFCKKCGVTKSVTEFYKCVSTRDRLRPHCKACNAIADAKYRADNPEKTKAYSAKWAAANPEKVKARSAKWSAANSEKRKESFVKRYAENPEAFRINCHNYRARKRANGGRLSKDIAERLFKLQRGKCACCKQKLGDDYHRDHMTPLALGGPNTDDNIQLLCPTCNLQKNKKHPIDFMQGRGFLL